MKTRIFDLRDTKRPRKEIDDQIIAAARIIREGGLLGIPTETVYGLAANGLDPDAVKKIFEAKGRPQDNPMILTIPGPQWLSRYCVDVPPIAYELTRRFWPGPLTLVLKRNPIVPDVTTSGLDTVAMRCPNQLVTTAIIREAGVPVAAPSANTSGRPSCTSAQDVLEDMDGKIDGIVDGGPCSVGVESTILDLTVQPPRLLRPGGLPVENLEAVIGHIDVDKAVMATVKDGEVPKAPGMKYRHYAPKAPVTVVTGNPQRSAREIAERMTPTSGIICFDEFQGLFTGHEIHSLGPSNDKTVQARRVFDALRAFDRSEVTEIFAQCPDNQGLGMAISNRLKKAAGFQIIEADHINVVLGITGGTGAGKTSALQAIRDLGGKTLDCDRIYYELLSSSDELQHALTEEFGNIFTSDGKLDRKRLGTQVFSNHDQMKRLNQIIFRFMRAEITRRMTSEPCSLYAIDAINLIEGGGSTLCDCTIAVTSPAELRVRRIMMRDGIDEAYARMRIAAQKTDDYYREKCDYVLENAAGTPEAFQAQAKLFFEKLIEKIKEEKLHAGEE